MKIVNIIGGLGNQMFQYAFAKALQCKYPGEQILVDISHFHYYNQHAGFQINRIFKNANITIATPKQLMRVTWYCPHYKVSRILRKILPERGKEYIETKDYVFNPGVFEIKKDCYFEGYWQSPLYFNEFSGEIKKMFTFPVPQGKNKDLEGRMLSEDSVAIHIRRGDYLNAGSFMGICGIDYYVRAIEYIRQKIKHPVLYIFSNDIGWCVQNITPLARGLSVYYISHNTGCDSFWDLFLMSKCKSMILANSSFSWWAAYLNVEEASIIISPEKWVNRDYDQDVFLKQWIKL